MARMAWENKKKLDSWCLQLVYVDDLHILVAGSEKFVWLWMILAAYEVLGTPFSYRKFKGGLSVEFVGFHLDYKEVTLGVIAGRGPFLSRFTAGVRCLTKGRSQQHLSLSGWSFISLVDNWSVVNSVTLVGGRRSCWMKGSRTDAKCEVGLVVLGGHEISSGRWFSVDVSCNDMPCLFESDGQCQWASGPAELLATHQLSLSLRGCLLRLLNLSVSMLCIEMKRVRTSPLTNRTLGWEPKALMVPC